MAGRQTPWKPSQPAITSHSSRCASPSCVKRHGRRRRIDAHIGDLEVQRQPGGQPRVDQVLDHLLLAVDRDRPPAGEIGQRDPVALAVEAQLDAVMHQPLAVHPLPERRPRPAGPSSPCSSTPARTRCWTYSRSRNSRITDSMPLSSSSRPSISPAGPPPTIATWVRIRGRLR